jgi:hypothetical protein
MPLEVMNRFHRNGGSAFFPFNTHHDLAGKIVPRRRLGDMAQNLPEFCIVLFVHGCGSAEGSMKKNTGRWVRFLAGVIFPVLPPV